MTAPVSKTPLGARVLVLLLIVGGGVWAVGQNRNSGTPYSAPAQPLPTTNDTAWVPADMTVSSDDANVAWRWMTKSEVKCSYSGGSCWGILALAHRGCPSSLYVELSLLDAAGNAVGLTNDVAGAVAPGQQAKLVFDTFEEDAQKARVAKVSCY